MHAKVFIILWRACRVLAACAIVAASLFVFPNGIPWMIAAWLGAYTLLVLRGRRGLLCLAACAGIVLAKRLAPAPGLLALLAVMLAVIGVGSIFLLRGRAGPSRRFARLGVIVLWIAWGGMTFDWFHATHAHHAVALKGDRPVVCLGDSMTSLGVFGGYPQELRKLITLPVVDMGISGWSAKQVLQHRTFLNEIAAHNPQAVVIELGAHDFLRFQGRAATKANLKAIVAACRQMDAEVVLLEIPRDFISDPLWGLEREICREEDVELMPDTAMRMLFLHSPILPPGSWRGEPYLTDESGIHPNAAGNRLLAEHVAAALERLYGPSIRRRGPSQPFASELGTAIKRK